MTLVPLNGFRGHSPNSGREDATRAIPCHRTPPTLGPVTSIVIVGSGFTGFTCARRLARILRRRNA
ncbi:hypothetical protein, partial [Mycobacterium sp. 852002-10029_SCH5224772]|uniref:hypothetical protein n=1 Tax=Mycobacterium sp. 852002-10029_SCH5224772 TaxID=1834083 RepID=UPI0012E7A27A